MTSVAKTVREYPEPGITSADIVDGTIVEADLADNAVTNAKLRDSGPLSVIGRAANSTGDPADISATAASGAVLRESGSTVGFGTVATAGIADDAVTFAKMQNITTARLLGRNTAGTGDVELIRLAAGGSLEFSTTNLQRAALTGDVTAAADSNATTIANDAVNNAKLRNSGALSVIGRSANSTGDPADISATAATGAVLRESGSVLGFGTVATAGIADNAVTYAKMQDTAAASVVIGRGSASAGDPQELTTDQGVKIDGTTVLGPRRYSNTAASTIANTAAETAFTQTITLAANELAAGRTVRLTMFGTISTTAFSPTIALKVKIGSTTVINPGPFTVNGLTDAGWMGIIQMQCFTAGGSGTVDSQGKFSVYSTITTTLEVHAANAGTATIDTTASQAVTITAQWSAASASNSITLRNILFEVF